MLTSVLCPEATLMAISVMGPLWGKIPFHYGVGHSAAYRKLPFRNGAHYGVTVMGSEMPLGYIPLRKMNVIQ